MVTREQRLLDFETVTPPAEHVASQVLCEDHNGTYVVPFACHLVEGAWCNATSGAPIDADVVGWRVWPR